MATNSIQDLVHNTDELIDFIQNSLSNIGCSGHNAIHNDPDGDKNWIIEIKFWDPKDKKWISASSGTPEPNALDHTHSKRLKWAKLLAFHRAIKELKPLVKGENREVVSLLESLSKKGLFAIARCEGELNRLRDILKNQ